MKKVYEPQNKLWPLQKDIKIVLSLVYYSEV